MASLFCDRQIITDDASDEDFSSESHYRNNLLIVFDLLCEVLFSRKTCFRHRKFHAI